jgi:hypothetical protein
LKQLPLRKLKNFDGQERMTIFLWSLRNFPIDELDFPLTTVIRDRWRMKTISYAVEPTTRPIGSENFLPSAPCRLVTSPDTVQTSRAAMRQSCLLAPKLLTPPKSNRCLHPPKEGNKLSFF